MNVKKNCDSVICDRVTVFIHQKEMLGYSNPIGQGEMLGGQVCYLPNEQESPIITKYISHYGEQVIAGDTRALGR